MSHRGDRNGGRDDDHHHHRDREEKHRERYRERDRSDGSKRYRYDVDRPEESSGDRRGMDPRGRARGYGRARGGSGGQQQRPGDASGNEPQRGPPTGGPPQQSAWGRPQAGPSRPPQPPQPPQPQPGGAGSWPKPPSQQAGQPSTSQPQRGFGRGGGGDSAPTSSEQAISCTVQGGATGNGDQASKRGTSIRGRQVTRSDILFTRPQNCASKNGARGRKVMLKANYVELITKTKWSLNQYRVDFNPEVDTTSKKRGYLYTAVRDLFRLGYLFDGTLIYTPQCLRPEAVELFVTDEPTGENIRINIKFVGVVNWTDYHYLSVFNLLMRKCLRLMGLQSIGDYFYDRDGRVDIREHNLQVWPGYVTSIRQHERKILLNVDLRFKVMRIDNVYNMLNECQTRELVKEFREKVVGQVVMTSYNQKTYRIDDVDFESTPRDRFQKPDGSSMSFIEYYQQRYRINIHVQDQPLLVSRSKPREIRAGMPETVKLIPELCQLTGLSDRQRDNFRLMQSLATYTRVNVDVRVKNILSFVNRAIAQPTVMEEIRRWDFNLANALVEVPARILDKEEICSGNGSKEAVNDRFDWIGSIRSKQMFVSGKMESIIVLVPGRLMGPSHGFVEALVRCARGMRWNIPQPTVIEIPNDRVQTYLEFIDRYAYNKSPPSLFIFILPNPNLDRYSAVKKKLCIDTGIPSQAILAKSLTKNVMSIATKVAIQLNCKVGGTPWSVVIPMSNFMVVGYDVCRDTTNKKKSFSAMVASLDQQCSRFFSLVMEHELEEELSHNISSSLVIACERYKLNCGKYPDRILVYRDGVGDGQIKYVVEQEVLDAKKKLIEKIYQSEENLKFGFIIVSKRTNTKFFLQDRLNPPSGTVVDDVVTMPERFDFFLVSQCVRQGSVAPTSYNVIEDTLGLGADRLQLLTYKMTHLYYNWSGPVRVPAPCQYAHKLAFLTSQSLHGAAHKDLQSTLFYL